MVVAAHKPLFVDESSLIQKTQELGEGHPHKDGRPGCAALAHRLTAPLRLTTHRVLSWGAWRY